jgi:hypothetical protein
MKNNNHANLVCNIKSAWYTIDVEKNLNEPQLSTLSKYFKIYGAHTAIICGSLLFDLIYDKRSS